MIKIYRTSEFIEWFESRGEKSKAQIDDRLSKIQNEEYFRVHKFVGDSEAQV
jgi:putative component of toxin-antitoxin plasmid stabilization module